MPFGVRNAAQTFQRFIDQVLRGLPFTYAYIDNLLITGSSADEHKATPIKFSGSPIRLSCFSSNWNNCFFTYWTCAFSHSRARVSVIKMTVVCGPRMHLSVLI